jgi:DNA-binding SARP family transcriptional activator
VTQTGARADALRTSSGTPTVLLRLLGPLTAVDADTGEELDLGGRRQRAVLGVLALARGDLVSAERLIDSLWRDAPPANAPGALQAYVSHLRKRLEPSRVARSRESVIASEGGGYALRIAADAVDAWRFEQLVQRAAAAEPAVAAALLGEALSLWRGPALAEYAGEPWADAGAVRLTQLRDIAREQLLDARLGSGEAAVLVPELTALVDDNPLREERWRLLALALYRANRQADALAALRRARETLADELGVDPGPALRQLESEILSQAPGLDAPSRPGVIPQPRADAESANDLVDRDREMSALQSCVTDAVRGSGQIALMQGPAGIGKTRLLTETRALGAGAGMLTLTARGSQLEKEFGFGAVRQLFEPTLVDPQRRSRLLTGAAASAASVFDGAPTVDRADGSFAVLHGLFWLTVNLAAKQPLLLAVDDLQWCDAGSLRFLAYLARRLDGLPVLVAGTLRTGEVHDDAELLDELAHDYATVSVRPEPLSIDGVGDLVRGRLGKAADDTFVAACHRTTGGNPLLLRQLLRALESDGVRPDASHADPVTAIGSRAISSLVLMRLSRLPASATSVARAIAVLGDGAELPAEAALAGLGEPDAAAAIAALSRAEVIRDELPLGFVHPLVRDAVYRDLPPGERQLHHDRAARALHAASAPPEQVAAHLMQVPARGDAWLVDVLRRAAATAAGRGAADSAAAYLNRALAEPPPEEVRTPLLVELGQVEALGDGPAAVVHLREAYAALTDPRQAAAVAQLLAQVLVFAGQPGEATAFARQARESVPVELDDERQGLLALERVSGYMHGVDVQLWGGSRPGPRGEGMGARMLSTVVGWELANEAVDRATCIEHARYALAGGDLQRVDPGLFWVVAAFTLDMADEDIGTFWDDALADAHARGSLLSALATHLWRGRAQWQIGDLREAEHSLLTACEQSERWASIAVGSQYGEAFLTEVLIDRGDVVGARALYDRAAHRMRVGDAARLFAEAGIRLLLAEGRYDEALHASVAMRGEDSIVHNPVWQPWRSLRGLALHGLGRDSEADELIRAELELARTWGAPRLVGRTLRMLGEVTGDVPTLREGVDVLAATPGRFEHARAQAALAAHVPDDEAVPLLRQALETAEDCGGDGLRTQAAAALRRLGVEVADRVVTRARLTTTEQRVAELHAAGHDARTIAQALFLTPRSVELTLATIAERERG